MLLYVQEFYIGSYYIKWVTTSWTYSMNNFIDLPSHRCIIHLDPKTRPHHIR